MLLNTQNIQNRHPQLSTTFRPISDSKLFTTVPPWQH